MFFIRQSNKIDRSIISFNAIQMMDYPANGKRFFMFSLPNNDMLQNIFELFGIGKTGVMRGIHINISSTPYNFSPLPIGRFCPSGVYAGMKHFQGTFFTSSDLTSGRT